MNISPIATYMFQAYENLSQHIYDHTQYLQYARIQVMNVPPSPIRKFALHTQETIRTSHIHKPRQSIFHLSNPANSEIKTDFHRSSQSPIPILTPKIKKTSIALEVISHHCLLLTLRTALPPSFPSSSKVRTFVRRRWKSPFLSHETFLFVTSIFSTVSCSTCGLCQRKREGGNLPFDGIQKPRFHAPA